MRSITVAVTCSDCGKRLRGSIGVLHGYHVRAHKRPDGTQCWGARRTDHRTVEGQ